MKIPVGSVLGVLSNVNLFLKTQQRKRLYLDKYLDVHLQEI